MSTMPTDQPKPISTRELDAANLTREATPPSAETVTLSPGIPGYELLGELGRGGMGVVYKARQVGLNRVVALKLILGGGHAGSQAIRRFLAEAEVVARLKHPNVVQIYDLGTIDNCPFFSLEFCGGGSLADQLAGQPKPPTDAARLTEQLARAVHFAHQAGVVHRDLKPANVLLDGDTTPKVTDFGLARAGDSGLTASGAIMGTPSYMAPEQARGDTRDVGPLSDVWALGAILYECLTGRPPFRADSAVATMAHVLYAEPVAVRQLNPSVPHDLETIAHKCLQKDPRKRYASADALADDLRRFLEGRPINARPVSMFNRGWRWCVRNPVVAGLLSAVVVSLLLGVGISSALAVIALDKAEAERLARGQADSAAQQSEADAREARNQKEAADRARNRAECLAYAGRLALARREWDAGQFGLARDTLAGARREPVPAWELRHLRRLFDEGHRTFTDNPGIIFGLAFHPDGHRLASTADSIVIVRDVATGRTALTLKGHANAVTSVAWSQDGRWLATGSLDRTVRIWDAVTGIERHSLPQPQSVLGVAFGPEGRLASATGASGSPSSVKVWDAAEGKELFECAGHPNQVWGIAYSQNGRRIATAGLDRIARVYDGTSGKPLHVLRGHTGEIRHLALSPDGTRLATAGYDPAVKVWNTEDGSLLRTYTGHVAEIHGIAISPDGKQVASSTAGWLRPEVSSIRVWDLETGSDRFVLRGHSDRVFTVAFSPDGKTIASGSQDCTVRLWDTAAPPDGPVLTGSDSEVTAVAIGSGLVLSGSANQTARLWNADTGQASTLLQGHTGSVNAVAIAPDGQTLATGSADRTARLWTRAGLLLGELRGHTGEVTAIVFSVDGRQVLTASVDQTVRVWDVGTRREVRQLAGHTLPINALALSPDGSRLLSGAGTRDGAGEVIVRDLASDVQTIVTQPSGVTAVAWSPTGKVWAAGTLDKMIRTQDENGVTQTLTGHDGPVRGLFWTPDGGRLVSGSDDRTVRVWDVSVGLEVMALRGHTGPVTGLAGEPSGDRFASASMDRTVRVWDGRAGHASPAVAVAPRPEEPRLMLQLPGMLFWDVALSRDGRHVAGAAGDGVVRVWETTTGRLVQRFAGHSQRVFGVGFGPGGRLASNSEDGTVRLWDVETGGAVRTIRDHATRTGPVWGRSAAWSPDGRRVAVASNDGVVRVWDAETGSEAFACRGHNAHSAIFRVAWSADGRFIASASADKTARVWDGSDGRAVSVCTGHEAEVPGVAFGPTGDWLATGSSDRTVRIWDAKTGQERTVLRGHGIAVFCVAVTDDGRHIVSGDSAGTLRLWDVDGQLLGERVRAHSMDIWGVAIAGTTLASTSWDGTIRLWPVDADSWPRRPEG